MIAKITRGSTAGGLAAYLHGPGRANEHAYGGRLGGAVIGGTLGAEGSRDGRGWAADTQAAIDGRPEIKGPVWHMSLRCAPGDRTLSDAEWRHAAQTMGEQMGWAAQPWVMVRHGADHVHVVVSRVGWDRSLWHARNDRRMAQEARRVVERDLGLKQAPLARRGGRSLSSGEHSRALRTGAEPPRHDLARRVRACAEAAHGLGRETFEGLLADQGVAFRANVAATGRVSGYSFALPGHTDAQGVQVWWKGSQLDRSLGWKTLGGTLSAPLPAPRVEVAPKKLLERSSTYQQRVQVAQREATARDVASRRRGAYRVAEKAIKERAQGAALPWRMRQAANERNQIGKKRAAHWEPVRMGGTPIGHMSVEDIENSRQIREIRAANYPNGPHAALRRGLTSRSTDLGVRTYADRIRDQNQDRSQGRGLGRAPSG